MKGNSGKALSALAGVCAIVLPVTVGCVSGEEEGGTLQQSVLDEDTFELDGDAIDDPAVPGDDWDTVLLGGGGESIANTGVLVDGEDETIFWKGGSKDIHDVTEWWWKDGNVPPKDDLLNAYAAAYETPEGDLSIYFGADRYAQNGSAQMGFWFFQNEVGLTADNRFSGEHEVGDVLVLADFTNGGKVSTIKIYEWVGSGGSEDTLDLIAEGEAGTPGDNLLCLSGMEACGVVNDESTPSPWPYEPKFGDANVFPPGAFFEGGINISALFGDDVCFASFLAETRASHEINSVLKDFVLGSLDTCKKKCEPKVKKECKVIKKNDEYCEKDYTASFTVKVKNTCDHKWPKGTKITVVDDAATADDPSDDVTVELVLDHPVYPGEKVELSGEFQTDENPPKDNVAHATVDTGKHVFEGHSEPTECDCISKY